MKNLSIYSFVIWGIIFLFDQNPNVQAQNQDEGLIYGKVVSVDGKTYQGQIRWGKEEALWTDIFNSSKIENPNLEYLSREDYALLEENTRDQRGSLFNWNFSDRRENKYLHLFACQFGEIKRLQILGKDEVDVTLRNGEVLHLEGGSNDIGAKVQVYDEEIGIIKLEWNRIDYVDFMATPAQLKAKLGNPLYGTVETTEGSFTGFIQWDHDERLSTDKLDGDSEDGGMSIEFGQIKSIAKNRRGSLIITKSGREFYLRGTNDVDPSNRGIIVHIPNQGRVDISWRYFEKLSFEENTSQTSLTYKAYPAIQKLQGEVITVDGRTLKGQIIYDLDEAWNIEMLHGSKNGIDYLIPFKHLQQIRPKNFDYTMIKLKNNQEIVLGDSQDVGEKHQGILVSNGQEEMTYIPWTYIQEINLR